MLIDCKDEVLIDFLDNRLNGIGIKYTKQWKSKYDIDFILDYEPLYTDGFYIMYDSRGFKELHYINKIAKEFIAKREYLERCLCLK